MLKGEGVNITAEQVVKAQQYLYCIYAREVERYFDEEVEFVMTPALMAKPGDEEYPSLIARLNEILSEEMPG